MTVFATSLHLLTCRCSRNVSFLLQQISSRPTSAAEKLRVGKSIAGKQQANFKPACILRGSWYACVRSHASTYARLSQLQPVLISLPDMTLHEDCTAWCSRQCIPGAAKSNRLKLFAVFSATVWDFSVDFYTFPWLLYLYLTAKTNKRGKFHTEIPSGCRETRNNLVDCRTIHSSQLQAGHRPNGYGGLWQSKGTPLECTLSIGSTGLQ